MRKALPIGAIVVTLLASSSILAQDADPPNILVIWGDDIGWSNVSAYGDGIMGNTTPNIDRIADEGIKFTDHYAQPCCTAGRAAFITGQYPIRSGMTTVGQPGVAARPAGRIADARRDPQGRGLPDRAFRQEPPRRPQRAPADRARLRRVLRQPVPPQHPGRGRATRLPALRRGLLRQPRGIRGAVRHPRRASTASPPTRSTRPSSRASASSARRPSRTPGR